MANLRKTNKHDLINGYLKAEITDVL
jgi:hypothetical protein